MMRRAVAGMLLVILAGVVWGEESTPKVYVEKVKSCPDFCQTDKRYGEMPGKGLEKKTTECRLVGLPSEGRLLRKDAEPLGADVAIVDTVVAFRVGMGK